MHFEIRNGGAGGFREGFTMHLAGRSSWFICLYHTDSV